MTKSKKHFLVIWPTIRKDWVSVFYQLKEEFVFTFLPSVFPKDVNFASEFDCRYWSQFDSAGQVLEELNPDALIFMSIDSGLSITLNYKARQEGVPTLILQHGIYTNYKDYRNREKIWKKETKAKEVKETITEGGFSTFGFILKSLKGLSKLWLLPITAFVKAQQKIGPYWADRHLSLSIKKASYYLCFSPYNSIIHRETDRIKERQIRYVGSHELKGYLNDQTNEIPGKYYIHLDQALAENSFGEETLTKEQVTEFYLKLNSYCLRQNARLYIKLHPESYESDWLPQDENILYLRYTDQLNRYIQSAEGCFGFYSTVVIPAIYWRPTVLFRIQYSGLQEAIKKLRAAQIIDFHTFEPSEIKFEPLDKSLQQKIRDTFILPEGVSDTTLKDVLADV